MVAHACNSSAWCMITGGPRDLLYKQSSLYGEILVLSQKLKGSISKTKGDKKLPHTDLLPTYTHTPTGECIH